MKKIKNLKAVDAVKKGKTLTAKYLLSAKIFKKYSGITRSMKYLYELSERHNWRRNTLLHIATYLEQNDTVKTILEIADIYLHNHTTAICNFRNKFKETPLHLSRSLEVVKLLVASGADVNSRTTTMATPLHYCRNNVDLAKFLILHGAIVNVKDDNGRTPLHQAESKEMAELLIEMGADLNAIDCVGMTPLYTKNVDIARALLKHGADVEQGNFKLVNHDSIQGPLEHAFYHRHSGMIRLLLENGADIHKVDKALLRGWNYHYGFR